MKLLWLANCRIKLISPQQLSGAFKQQELNSDA